jgi:hypothetical protein
MGGIGSQSLAGGVRLADDAVYKPVINNGDRNQSHYYPYIIKLHYPNGRYSIRLGFNSSFGATGTMNLSVNGAPWINNFCPYTLAGNKNAYPVHATSVTVTDSLLTIMISAIDSSHTAYMSWMEVFPGDTNLTGVESNTVYAGLLPSCAISPNPFSRSLAVKYYLPNSGRATLRVFDMAGRLIRELSAGQQQTGWHNVQWNGCDARGLAAASGWYLIKAELGGQTLLKRVLRVR